MTGSRLRLPAGAYAWRRFLRIFPGLWVCLLVTAFVLAPTVGALRGGWSLPDALRYTGRNAPMVFSLTNEIGTTVRNVPVPSSNGSLWTLRHEIACYVLVGLAGFSGMFRSKPWLTAGGFGAITGVVVVLAVTDTRGLVVTFAVLLSFFLAGSALLPVWGPHPLDRPGGGTGHGPASATIATHTVKIFGALPVAYLCLWTATVLSGQLRKVGISQRPVVRCVHLWLSCPAAAVPRWGTHWPTDIAGLACVAVLPFAAMSWLLVERPAMQMKTYGRWGGSPTAHSLALPHDDHSHSNRTALSKMPRPGSWHLVRHAAERLCQRRRTCSACRDPRL